MIYYKGSCENMTDCMGNKPRLFGCYWKKIHLGIIKIWLGYELYEVINFKTKEKKATGKHLSTIEIKWSWK